MVQRNLTINPLQYTQLCNTFTQRLQRQWLRMGVDFEKLSPNGLAVPFDWFVYCELRDVCNDEQHELLDDIFGKDCPYSDGEPVWVRDFPQSPWELRYSNGNGDFYLDQKKSGDAVHWREHRKFDFGELPVND